MKNESESKKRKHPRKVFAVPADIRALGVYGVVIVDAMRAEFRKRMGRAAT